MKKVKVKHPDTELVTILEVADPIKAELIRNQLRDHQIDCEIGNQHQAGFTGAGVLPVEIIVREEDVQRAEQIIAEHFDN